MNLEEPNLSPGYCKIQSYVFETTDQIFDKNGHWKNIL